jgi:hypothetical protein
MPSDFYRRRSVRGEPALAALVAELFLTLERHGEMGLQIANLSKRAGEFYTRLD